MKKGQRVTEKILTVMCKKRLQGLPDQMVDTGCQNTYFHGEAAVAKGAFRHVLKKGEPPAGRPWDQAQLEHRRKLGEWLVLQARVAAAERGSRKS